MPTRSATADTLRLLALAVPALLAGACTGTSPAAKTASPAPSTTVEQPTATGSDASTAAATGAATVTMCAPDDIRATLIGQAQRTTDTTRMALLQLTNVSTHACRVQGWASVTLVNAANHPVQVPTTKVALPGAEIPVDLRPGTTASAGIKWTVCNKAGPDCPTGNSVRVGLPGSTSTRNAELSEFPAAERSDITMRSLQIGTIQPSSQGVVAW